MLTAAWCQTDDVEGNPESDATDRFRYLSEREFNRLINEQLAVAGGGVETGLGSSVRLAKDFSRSVTEVVREGSERHGSNNRDRSRNDIFRRRVDA